MSLRLYRCRIAAACVLLLFALMPPVYGQKRSFRSLENKVFQLNNALKYYESQALLLPVLQNETFTADDKYQASILLSYTYKRLQDYVSTLQFLEKARVFARQTPKKDQYLAVILGQEAFVYFDIHNYAKADSLMQMLAKTNFRHIDPENTAKLIHQQGYLLFLAKRYPEAEATYNRAIAELRLASPCDLPMIYVKMMQLYAAMNQMNLVQKALRQSNVHADSCGIIKYHIYAYEELRKIYETRNDLPRMVAAGKIVDSLNTIYARSENIAALHNQKETLLLREKDQRLQKEQGYGRYLTAGAAGLGLLTIGLLVWLLIHRQKQQKLETEFSQMKTELATYVTLSRSLPTARAIIEKTAIGLLSDRQQEVLTYLSSGLSNKEIADKLSISENTVKYHIKNVYQLLDIRDRRDLFLNGSK